MFEQSTVIYQLIRVIVLGGIATLFSFIMAPLLLKFLKDKQMIQHIHRDANAPIFTAMHEKKEGTPTTAGILV